MTWLSSQLDRVLTPNYLDGVDSLPLDAIRSMRAECQEAETAVSFLRRLAQGRLDIIETYLQRRREGADTDLNQVVQELATIIGTGPPRPAGPGRLPMHMAPDLEIGDLTEELDGILDADRIADLPSMDEADLQRVADELIAFEVLVSDQRRALHDRIDRLQAELVARYKSGQASVDGLLA